MDADLARVRGADVFLVFIESYGAISYERPDIAPHLAAEPRGARRRRSATRSRDVVSAFVESPTFGGSSWLAHISLMSGVEVRDPATNARLMTQQRDTLVTAFERHGYRTVALMPGLRQRWPEGAFYGFDEIYGAARLDYRGPEFGWFADSRSVLARAVRRARAQPAVADAAVRVLPDHQHALPVQPDAAVSARLGADAHRHAVRRPRDRARRTRRSRTGRRSAPATCRRCAYDYATLAGYLRANAGTRSRDDRARRSSAGGGGQRRRRAVGRAGARHRAAGSTPDRSAILDAAARADSGPG